MKLFDRLNSGIRDGESSIVNFLSAVAPWAAPIAPAYMSWYHMTGSMAFPPWVAWAIAAVVEILGLSAISTIISFWSHNKRYKTEYKQAPVWLAIFSFVFYLGVILLINVMLDASNVDSFNLNSDIVTVAAKAMLTLLSIPAAVILAVRTQHTEVLNEIITEKEDRKNKRWQIKTTAVRKHESNAEAVSSVMPKRKSKFFNDVASGKLEQYLKDNNMTYDAKTVAALYGTSERTVWRWFAELNRNKE